MRHDMHCQAQPVGKDVDQGDLDHAVKTYLGVSGLGCPNCAIRVRNALVEVSGVVDAEVDATRCIATVWHRKGETRPKDLVRSVVRAGAGTHHDYMAVPLRSWFRNRELESSTIGGREAAPR